MIGEKLRDEELDYVVGGSCEYLSENDIEKNVTIGWLPGGSGTGEWLEGKLEKVVVNDDDTKSFYIRTQLDAAFTNIFGDITHYDTITVVKESQIVDRR